MSDQINNQNSEGQNSNTNSILKELSDIKTNLAVNSAETKNIKDIVFEVKSDVKEMKKNYINQEQHTELMKRVASLEDKAETLETSKTTVNVMLTIGIGILTLLVSLLTYHIMRVG